MKRKRILIFACGLMVLSALLSALCRSSSRCVSAVGYGEIPEFGFSPRLFPEREGNAARDFGSAIADAVEKVMPSVVVVRTEKIKIKFKEDAFGFISRVPKQLTGEGSGVIIDRKGYVVTSWHVVESSQQIEVVLNDGSKFPARCVGHDQVADLAVLKIEAAGKNFSAVEFGDSDALRVGEVVIAIGSPFSLQSSVTVGHVSQKGRRVQILPYEDFIQTDAAINEGNSGGALIDVDGRLIGINTAKKMGDQEQGVGIAFAVPSNLAVVIVQSLIRQGKHEWPWVGAFFGTLTPAQNKFGEASSAVISRVWDATSAARSGILPGDLILKVDGSSVRDEHDVRRIIYNHSVGERLVFLLQRQGKRQPEIELLLEEFPGETF